MTDNNRSVRSTPEGSRSLADRVSDDAPTTAQRLSQAAWVKIVVVAGLFVAMTWRQYLELYHTWLHDENWTHGFIIPLFSLYLLYSRRRELAAAPRGSSVWGLVAAIVALIGQVGSEFFLRNHYITQINMLIMLLGLVLYLCGWKVLRLAWLPIAFLFFALPIPGRIYTAIAYPLQVLAAKCSYLILSLFGVVIHAAQSKLEIISVSGQKYPLVVAEACSGVRSLMAFGALAVAMAYLQDRPAWQRIVFALMIVPIALACNVLRVTITCAMHVIDKPELGSKFMHEFTGMLMLIPALALLWLVGKLLEKLFVEVDEEEPAKVSGAPEGK